MANTEDRVRTFPTINNTTSGALAADSAYEVVGETSSKPNQCQHFENLITWCLDPVCRPYIGVIFTYFN